MKKRWLALVLALAMALSLFAGCGGKDAPAEDEKKDDTKVETPEEKPEEKPDDSAEPAEKKILRVGLNIGDEDVYDPAIHWNAAMVSTSAMMFEPLTMPAEEGGVRGAGAESWDVSEDGLTYTFHIRKGMKWSDGEPVTAHDYAYNVIRCLTPETGSGSLADYLPIIKNGEEFYAGKVGLDELGVKVVDDYTLEYTLNYLVPYFPEQVMSPFAAPTRKDVVEADPEKWSVNETGFPSCGPFTPVKIKFGTSIEFVKNENYWDAENVKLDGMVFNYFADSNTAWSAYQAGELDMCFYNPGGAVRDLYTQNSDEVKVFPTLYRKCMLLNNMEDHLDTVDLRMAVINAIDRQAIIDNEPTGFLCSLLDGVVPKGCFVNGKDFRETVGSYYNKPHADLEACAEYLAKAGYPNGEGLRNLVILSNNDESSLKVAQIIQEQLKAANIPSEITPIEPKAYFTTMLEGKYDMCIGADMGSIAHPMSFMLPANANKESNPEHYKNPAYDEAFNKAKYAVDPAEQFDAFAEAEGIYMADAGRLHIYTRDNAMVVKPYVEGYWANIGGIRMFADCDIVK